MPQHPGSLLDRLMSAALTLLVAVGVLYVAVHLLLAIWLQLLLIASLGLIATAGFAVWRQRNRGW